jgi:DNA polymerase elongation subunit (family B)
MKPLAFDIETIPDEAKENLLPEPEAAKNIKDPEKVKEDIAKKKAAMISQMGLSPFTGRVCSFAVYGEEKAMQYSSTIKTISDTDEINLLVQIFSLLASVPKDYNIITWNGVNFDFPYIFKRGHAFPFHWEIARLSNTGQKNTGAFPIVTLCRSLPDGVGKSVKTLTTWASSFSDRVRPNVIICITLTISSPGKARKLALIICAMPK